MYVCMSSFSYHLDTKVKIIKNTFSNIPSLCDPSACIYWGISSKEKHYYL